MVKSLYGIIKEHQVQLNDRMCLTSLPYSSETIASALFQASQLTCDRLAEPMPINLIIQALLGVRWLPILTLLDKTQIACQNLSVNPSNATHAYRLLIHSN